MPDNNEPAISERDRIAAAVRPMPASAPKAGYAEFQWSGYKAYQCAGCPYSTTELRDIVVHVDQIHPEREAATAQAQPPLLRKGGVLQSSTGADGVVTFEEVKTNG